MSLKDEKSRGARGVEATEAKKIGRGKWRAMTEGRGVDDPTARAEETQAMAMTMARCRG